MSFSFHPYLGRWCNLTHIFSIGLKPPTSPGSFHWKQTWRWDSVAISLPWSTHYVGTLLGLPKGMSIDRWCNWKRDRIGDLTIPWSPSWLGWWIITIWPDVKVGVLFTSATLARAYIYIVYISIFYSSYIHIVSMYTTHTYTNYSSIQTHMALILNIFSLFQRVMSQGCLVLLIGWQSQSVNFCK